MTRHADRFRRVVIRLCGSLFAVLGLAGPAVAQKAATAPDRVTVLDRRHPVRFMLVAKTDQARLASGEIVSAAGEWLDPKRRPTTRQTEPPPEAWRQPTFDDSAWPSAPAPIHTSRERVFSLVCARTRFRVDDPAAIKDLALTVSYCGGVVIHLNGRELARGHMPEGPISPDTPAVDYEPEAYVNPAGFLLRQGWGDPEKYKDRFALRYRSCKVTIPAERLVAGVNVLAVEAHRPITSLIYYTGKPEQYEKSYCPWQTLSLNQLALTAAAPVTARKLAALRLSNQSPAEALRTDDPGNPDESLGPTRLFGCRGGAFTGAIGATSGERIGNLRVSAGDLSCGEARIPAAAVQVRFGRADRGIGVFNCLDPQPADVIAADKGLASTLLWVTVQVPADAKAGEYTGELKVSADGCDPVAAPLALSVADWALADVTESQSWWWLLQSPETLSMIYRVPMWSPEHLELIGQSFDLMRQVGTRIIYVPLFRESCFGNREGMIRWIAKDDGGWDCDFSVFEKYLDTAVKHLGKLDVVCIHSWPRTSGGSYFGQNAGKEGATPYRYTRLDPKTGATTQAEGPDWNRGPEMTAFLKPAFDGIRRRLADRKISERALMVGICHDVVPSPACMAVLKEASGGAVWVKANHPGGFDIAKQPVGYVAHVWGSPTADFPGGKRAFGWNQGRFYATFPRAGSGTAGTIRDSASPAQLRVSLEAAMVAGIRGYGWCGGDFWGVLKDRHNRPAAVFDRYNYDGRGNLGILHATSALLGQGLKGPVPTVRQQAARAGLQEAEARAYIERALADPARRSAMGDELATQAQRLLDQRQSLIVWGRFNWDIIPSADWELLSGRLFAMAATIASKASPSAGK